MSAQNEIPDREVVQGLRQRFAAFREHSPHLFLLALMVIIPLFFMNLVTWVTLTVSGLAMGLMLFIMASGMTLTFGLMSVLNLGHGAFISLGAFSGASVIAFWMSDFANSGALGPTLLALFAAFIFSMAVAGSLGLLFERFVIRPVYGDHLKQILVTVGGAIILMELIHVIWGPNEIPVPRPQLLRGAVILDDTVPLIGGVAVETYRLAAVLLGLLVYALMSWVIDRTKAGILIRAGVESTEMVEIMGYRIKLLFLGVFIAGSALAGLGGAMWAMYQEIITAHMGETLMISVIVVIILGGLGSIKGCFYGAILVGLINLYVGYLAPVFAAIATVGLMVGILMWRPQGLIPVIKV